MHQDKAPMALPRSLVICCSFSSLATLTRRSSLQLTINIETDQMVASIIKVLFNRHNVGIGNTELCIVAQPCLEPLVYGITV